MPVFGGFTLDVNTGVLGGLLLDIEETIKQLSEVTFRVAHGEGVDTFALVTSSPFRMRFDYHVLQRFGLTPSDLLTGSEIINQPVSFYQQNK